MRGGRSNFPLDDILTPLAEDMIDNIGEESEGDGETRRPNPRGVPTTKTGFQKFEQKLRKRIIRQQWNLAFIRNCALGLFANSEQSVVANQDVTWLRKHDHIVNPLAAGSLANRKRVSSRPAAN